MDDSKKILTLYIHDVIFNDPVAKLNLPFQTLFNKRDPTLLKLNCNSCHEYNLNVTRQVSLIQEIYIYSRLNALYLLNYALPISLYYKLDRKIRKFMFDALVNPRSSCPPFFLSPPRLRRFENPSFPRIRSRRIGRRN